MTTDSESSTPRRPRVLLGVTGSVAAVKAPEVAVRLVKECNNATVKVLLSAGGLNFWNKAANYDPKSWKQLQELLAKPRDENGDRSIEIHGT